MTYTYLHDFLWFAAGFIFCFLSIGVICIVIASGRESKQEERRERAIRDWGPK